MFLFSNLWSMRRLLCKVLHIGRRSDRPHSISRANPWLNIAKNGAIALTIGSSEIGQGSYSGPAQILSEDLMVNYTRIQTAQGVPATGKVAFGNSIGAFGSSLTYSTCWRVRQAGAAACEMAGGPGLMPRMIKSRVPPVPRLWGPGEGNRAACSASTHLSHPKEPANNLTWKISLPQRAHPIRAPRLLS
jgi:hypothetical protein